MKWKTLIFLLIFTLIGGFIRFYHLSQNPISLSVDEVSTGINAYSILKTGRDEFGNFWPLSFRSLGDYKPPVYTYLVSLSESIFGLNEFAVRFPSALLGTLTIPLFYFFALNLLHNKKYALLDSSLIAISPWHVFLSRVGWESIVALFFIIIGMICFFKIRQRKWYWIIGSSFFLALSMYSYHAERLFVPLFIIAYYFLYRKELYKQKDSFTAFTVSLVLFITPLIFLFLFGPDKTRAQMTFITSDVDFIRNVRFGLNAKNDLLAWATKQVLDNSLLFFYWLRKYLAYFHPSFLFTNGLKLTNPDTYGLGVMYLFEIPFFLFGTFFLIFKNIANKKILILWALLSLLPASLTISEHHLARSFIILPMTIIISSIGAVELSHFARVNFSAVKQAISYSLFLVVILWNLIFAYLIFFIHFPIQRGEDFMEGTKDTVLYALKHKNQYDEIVFDPVRGIQGPYIVSVPHAYILFYSKYDPAVYLSEKKEKTDDLYRFDKFTVRPIDWRIDRYKKGVLFIGSPWSLPVKDIKSQDILEKFYLKNGERVFLAVSPS